REAQPLGRVGAFRRNQSRLSRQRTACRKGLRRQTMFGRLGRLIKSWLGYFISFAEDPEVMLQESIEEMRNTLPRLNQILVTTRATVIRLEQEKEELERKERQVRNSIQAALTEGSPEARRIAEDDASTLQQVRQELQATSEQLTSSTNAFQNAQ